MEFFLSVLSLNIPSKHDGKSNTTLLDFNKLQAKSVSEKFSFFVFNFIRYFISHSPSKLILMLYWTPTRSTSSSIGSSALFVDHISHISTLKVYSPSYFSFLLLSSLVVLVRPFPPPIKHKGEHAMAKNIFHNSTFIIIVKSEFFFLFSSSHISFLLLVFFLSSDETLKLFLCFS